MSVTTTVDTTAETSAVAEAEADSEPAVDVDTDNSDSVVPLTSEERTAKLVELAGTVAFADDDSVAEAVAAFNDAGLDFSPGNLTDGLPTDCAGLDADTVSEILGLEVYFEDREDPFLPAPGYLSCGMRPTDSPFVFLASFNFSPDLNGLDNWVVFEFLDRGAAVPDLGDSAEWWDSSVDGDDNGLTTLQFIVEQGGSQTFVEAFATPGQLEVIGSWSLPKIFLSVAALNASLT